MRPSLLDRRAFNLVTSMCKTWPVMLVNIAQLGCLVPLPGYAQWLVKWNCTEYTWHQIKWGSDMR